MATRRKLALYTILALLPGYLIGRYQAGILSAAARGGEPDPTVCEKYAVLKSPDGEWACVVTRQHYDIDFFTFTFWWLDPHSHQLLFPIETAPLIVRENLEEGPPTKNIKLEWEGDEVVARFDWPDGTPSARIRGNWRSGWHFGDRPTTSPATFPSSAPASAMHHPRTSKTQEWLNLTSRLGDTGIFPNTMYTPPNPLSEGVDHK